MSSVKLSGSLPAGPANGLGSIASDMVDHPHDLRPVIVLIDCNELRTDTDTGEVVPRGRIRRIEPIPPSDLRAARALMRRAHEHRTGREQLPLEFEEQLDEAFGPAVPQS